MRKILIALTLFLTTGLPVSFAAEEGVKEWTIMVFLNGHNNLDSYGAKDINEMEKIGSTKDVNIVVQWASSAAKDTKRVLVKKDNDPKKVTSPAVQSLPRVDMGDYKQLVEFIKWTAQQYPAKRYFVDIWNHGSGWHDFSGSPVVKNISNDDYTGHSITTQQLGMALNDAATTLGRKIDIYGSDACLMEVLEVNHELSKAVEVTLGSQETEPGDGWPYDTFLKRVVANPVMRTGEVAAVLTEEYIASYSGGTQGNSGDVTFSATDLTKGAALNAAIAKLSTEVKKLETADRSAFLKATKSAKRFTTSDAADLLDMISVLQSAKIKGISATTLNGVVSAAKGYIVANKMGTGMDRANGVSIWMPTSSYSYKTYKAAYEQLLFSKDSRWGEALAVLMK